MRTIQSGACLAVAARAGAIAIALVDQLGHVMHVRMRLDRTPSVERVKRVKEKLDRLARNYAVETIVAEPGGLGAHAVFNTGRVPELVDIALAKHHLVGTGQQTCTLRDLFNVVLARAPELTRFVPTVKRSRTIATIDRRQTTLLIAVALGLAYHAQRKAPREADGARPRS